MEIHTYKSVSSETDQELQDKIEDCDPWLVYKTLDKEFKDEGTSKIYGGESQDCNSQELQSYKMISEKLQD